MIRIERDPAFWTDVVARIGGDSTVDLAALCAQHNVLPLASRRGGFFFVRLDAAGFCAELHTLFTPDAWGSREIVIAAKQAFNALFLCGFQLVTTLEVRANARSQPPLSFGFVRAGDWRDSPVGECRAWILTRAAFEASPACRRLRARSH